MDSCDALIIGGGPAGSTCARALRNAGLDVIILDKASFPRPKTCAGWITPAVVDAVGLDPADYAATRTFQPISAFRTGLIGGRAVHTQYDHPVSFGIRRCEFDHYLLQRSGARLHLGERVESIERNGGGWTINKSISAPLLIGAGGHFCPVARLLGAGAPRESLIVAAQEIEFEMTPAQREHCAVRADTPELYFCPDLKGYAWCFRKGDYLNVGLGREDQHNLAEHVGAFSDLMKSQGRIPADAPTRFSGHAYILYGHTVRRTVDDGVLLIGDAAGLAYAQSGEGIRPAIESGLLAAGAIIAARGDYRRESLQSFANQLQRRFGAIRPKPSFGARLESLIPASLQRTLARRLFATGWFSKRVVIDRWFLRANQTALAQA